MTKQTIWKEEFELDDMVTLVLPEEAEILSCQIQNERPCIWYLCDPTLPKKARLLRVVGTGHPITNEKLKFIDTIQLMNGRLVFHIFELLKVWD